MKKILLMCPHFMGYDEILVRELKKNYDVTYVDTDQFLADKRKKYKELSILKKGILKYCPKLKEYVCENLLRKDNSIFYEIKSICLKKYDIILVINGDAIPNDVYQYLKNKNKEAILYLYIWDDFKWLFKKQHIKFFEHIYSYNIEDCQKYKFKYMPVFTQQQIKLEKIKKVYDIAIIASASDNRVKFAQQIYNKYKNKYKFYIYFYDKENKYKFFSNSKPLAYEEYVNKIAQSKAALEIVRLNQKGPTTRVFDSIAVHTKVISTNKHLKKYSIYGKNVLILDDKLDIPESFMEDSYIDMSDKVMSVDNWARNIIDDK